MYFDSHDLSSIVVAIIGGFGVLAGVVLAFVLPFLVSIRRHAKTAAHEVKNDHTVNMRVEQDTRFTATTTDQQTMLRLQRAQARRLGTIDRRISRVVKRLEIVEETIPRRSNK